ncbi:MULTISPECIES: LCP family protein [unclassified Streptomyces]|uniref:LCP family protein n=1 Tax=unclassified Streptomyces TaxID=2593676 RepID=UPI001661C11E|nr:MULTISPECIES: LCP family protein [unclassified Streptomyces]MBD0844059.1 LCP family protein [Streptomyces sp. TRM68416]
MTKKRALSSLTLSGIVLAAGATLLGSSALPGRPQAPHGLNILVMGTDGRSTITAEEKRKFYAGGVACECADMLMLVHLSARRDRVSVVSLPRDSLSELPPYRDEATGQERPPRPVKLNGAYAVGGAALTVHTVEAMTGVRVDRYLQVDFRRFIDTVNQVGGVEVCTPRTLKDEATKLHLKPGKHRLRGGPALQYVRSRKVDRAADLGRIQRQQRFLLQALRGTKASGLLTDPVAMGRVAGTLLGAPRVDQGIGARELVELAAALKRVPAKSTEFATVPIAGFNPVREGVGSTLAWDWPKARAMFKKLREDRPLLKADARPRPYDPPRMTKSVTVRGSAYACK